MGDFFDDLERQFENAPECSREGCGWTLGPEDKDGLCFICSGRERICACWKIENGQPAGRPCVKRGEPCPVCGSVECTDPDQLPPLMN